MDGGSARSRCLQRLTWPRQIGEDGTKGDNMRREELTEKILDIKREKGWTWKHITT